MSSPGEIVFENATASYGSFVAMGPASLRVRAGEFLAVVGPSGCGKSTFLNLVAGTLRPSSGRVLYNGAPVDGPNRDVGYITQKNYCLPWRTVEANIRLPLEFRGMPRDEIDRRVTRAIASGPYRDYPAMDVTVQAMCGVMSITGYPDAPPVKAGPALCDFFAGIHLYGGIVTALYEREKTGTWRVVEVSMQESVYASLASNLGMYYGRGGEVPPRTGNRHGGLAEAPYNVYPTRDGYIAIICNNNRHFHALLTAMNRDDLKDDPRLADLKSRVANIDYVDHLVSAWTSGFDRDGLTALLLAHRVPHAPVRDLREVMHDPNMHARGSLQTIDHPEFGQIVVSHSPMRYDGLPLRPLEPSHRLGADNAAVYGGWLGLGDAELEALARDGVV